MNDAPPVTVRDADGGGGNLTPTGIPVSLYVHIPWCVRKCPYCDFNSHVARAPLDQQGYVDALLLDLDHEIRRQPPGEIGSIFFGGGTPSLLDGVVLGRLLEGIDQRLPLAADVEVTLEANPGTAEAARFADYHAAGVNRLSLGIQSLNDTKLAALGRIHDAAEAIESYRMARQAGFDNINLDLMFGLPGQCVDEALDDLQRIIALEPTHVSWYQLTLEPNTLFHDRPPPLPDDDLVAGIAAAGLALLDEVGFARYEISAFARAGRSCRHNLNYWGFGDYIGIGAGAHGKSTEGGRILRRSKRRQPDAYVAAVAEGGLSLQRVVSEAELPVEFLLNALRLVDGVPSAWFEQRTGLAIGSIRDQLQVAQLRELMEPTADRLRATALGLAFLNDLLALFEPEPPAAGLAESSR
jgi:oxygen-independent coproporphyrinogen-3 oxidase